VLEPALPPPSCDHSGAVQYFPPGPELLLSNEAADLEDYLKMRQAHQP
jgi:hypothetical protein